MKGWPSSEAALAEPVLAYLREQGWECYQEVQLRTYGRVADLVVVQNVPAPLVGIVECKRTLTFSVLEQAEAWRDYAHFRYVAVPKVGRESAGRALAYRVALWLGIGIIEVRAIGRGTRPHGFSVTEPAVAPREPTSDRRARGVEIVLRSLSKTHQSFAAAGNSMSLRWTPFQQTCEQVRRFVDKHPGCSMVDVLANVPHHYRNPATARSCLLKWGKLGSIHGVHVEQEGRNIRFWPRICAL